MGLISRRTLGSSFRIYYENENEVLMPLGSDITNPVFLKKYSIVNPNIISIDFYSWVISALMNRSAGADAVNISFAESIDGGITWSTLPAKITSTDLAYTQHTLSIARQSNANNVIDPTSTHFAIIIYSGNGITSGAIKFTKVILDLVLPKGVILTEV